MTKFTSRPTCCFTASLNRAISSQSTTPITSTSMSLPGLSAPDAKEPKIWAVLTPRMRPRPRLRIRLTSPSRRSKSRTLATRSLRISAAHSRRFATLRLVTAPARSKCSSASCVECGSAEMRRAISRVCSASPGALARRLSAARAVGLRPRRSARRAIARPYNNRCITYNSRCNYGLRRPRSRSRAHARTIGHRRAPLRLGRERARHESEVAQCGLD